ncbi:MAG: MBOAT family protein [Erysipelotrichaceae bacterium]|nr:MBOAT family protein [Erysipelotrichaceae bacterium]
MNFAIFGINSIFNSGIQPVSILIPMGISFFTFEAVSFLADVYNEKIKDKPSILNVYLYLSFFTTVTSGPIIRFKEFNQGLRNNLQTINYANAIERIMIGLCKKVLIADKISVLANYYFDGVALGNQYSSIGLWLGSIAYTLQLYFDFSGYSDIAIGIGQLLGFSIRENFNKPYQAGSISDFWKRWHISLTQWFRDYVYIPLGGNRCSIPRHILNMLSVWLLTGIWHGTDLSFILWGLGYFVLLVIEKYIPFMKKLENTIIGRLYTLFFVNLLWILFRADNLKTAAIYIKGLFSNITIGIEDKAMRFIPFILCCILLCFPWNKLFAKWSKKKWFALVRGILLIMLSIMVIAGIVNSAYTPYIYGNF